jgi:hypothetical protein
MGSVERTINMKVTGWQGNTGLDLILLSPEHLRIKARLLPGLLTKATDHIPGFTASIL